MKNYKHVSDFRKEIDTLTKRNSGKPVEVEGPNGVFMSLTKENWEQYQKNLKKKLRIK